MGPRNFREYPVWNEAVNYATFVYKVTNKMPWFEKKDCVISCKGLLFQ